MGCVVRNGRLRLNQGQIFWRETGQGKAIAFIHREYSDSSQWLDFFENLGRDHQCFAPDLLGFGDSDPAVSSQSIQWQSEILAEFFSQLNLKKIYFVGDALGAWVATRYALNNPEKIQGLILLSPIGFEAPNNAGYFLEKCLLLPIPILPWGLKLLYPLGKLIGLGQKIQKLLNYRQQLLKSPASRRLLFQRHPSEIQAEYLNSELSQLTAPTLIVSADQGSHQALLFAKKIPQSQMVKVQDKIEAIALIKNWLNQQQT
ncbi:alpha/beta fold hydrolase [Picosynechococcus sp. PCC 73109]|uniref:alpha/beta fold hydrolase n=1 Tax=Picosynechococcus sp. PCC 73109 TaxID=374982 RepID=UPI0007458855|nr:alpha/beta fold hydrolase [Picosynechococcus sp. PCC 73109]AMA08486.1 alpha/beta hydrolase [Picosynechococcus sp. PCC 73109]